MPPTPLPAEFGLIARHFRPLAGPGSLDLQDDAAVVMPPPGRELVLTTDTIVAGVHFLPDDPPGMVAQKLLRVNLSDLAAMGATPWAYLLNVSVPRDTGSGWWTAFAAGLALDQATYGLTLLGGDTTSTPGPVSLTATLIGTVVPGQALRRVGAVAGDGLYVTGTIGDGALGLRALRGEVPDPDGYLAERYRRPVPRLGLVRFGDVHACMDVSDGLLQDAGHLARAAGLGVVVDAWLVPLSDAARACGAGWLEVCLTGGDDYELLVAAPIGGVSGTTRVGEFVVGEGVEVVALNRVQTFGWSHFAV